jgi:hypothetical protein
VKQLSGSNLGSTNKSQLDAISGEVRAYVGAYSNFMARLKTLGTLVQQGKDLTREGADPRKITDINSQIQALNQKATQDAAALSTDQPKMANVLTRFADIVKNITPKQGGAPLTAGQQQALGDCVRFLNDFAAQLKQGNEGWLATEEWIKSAMQQNEVYTKSKKTGDPRLPFKNPAGGGGATSATGGHQ